MIVHDFSDVAALQTRCVCVKTASKIMMQDQGELTGGLSAGRQPSLLPFRRSAIAPGQAQQLLTASQQQEQGAAQGQSGVAAPPAMSSVEAAVAAALEEADGTALKDQVGHISS